MESRLWNPDYEIQAVESWLWIPGYGIQALESLLWNPGCGIVPVESWLRNPGCGILAVVSLAEILAEDSRAEDLLSTQEAPGPGNQVWSEKVAPLSAKMQHFYSNVNFTMCF